jgi:hypothetical protein
MIRHCARFNPKTRCISSVECQVKSGRPSLLRERERRLNGSRSMIGLVAGGGVVVFAGGCVFGTILRLWFSRFDRAVAKQREKPETFVGFLRAFVDELSERTRRRSHEVVLMAFLLRTSWRGRTPPHNNRMTHRKTYTRAQRLITISCRTTTRAFINGLTGSASGSTRPDAMMARNDPVSLVSRSYRR